MEGKKVYKGLPKRHIRPELVEGGKGKCSWSLSVKKQDANRFRYEIVTEV